MTTPWQESGVDAEIADVEYDRDHQADGITDDEAAERGQDRYERAIGMTP